MATHSGLLAAGGLLLWIASRARVWRVDSAGGDKTIVEAGVHAQRRDGVDQSMVQQREMELRIRRAEHHHENQDDLEERRQLAVDARGKGLVTPRQDDHHRNDENENIPAQYQDGQPPGKLFLEGQNDKRGREQKFIGDGKQLAWWLTILDRKSTRLNSSHRTISYAVFCLKKKNK